VPEQAVISSTEVATSAGADDGNRGSTVIIQHTSRQMKLYGIFEEELNSLESMNSEGRFWSAVLAGVLALMFGSAWDVASATGEMTSQAKAFVFIQIITFVVAAARLLTVSIRRSVTLSGIRPDRKTPILYRTYHRLKDKLDNFCTDNNQ